jgi:hypothetical protein
MDGKYILRKLPSIFARQRFLLSLLIIGGISLLIIVYVIIFLFIRIADYQASATLFVLSIGIAGYLFNSIVNRQLQLNEVTNKVLITLRERYDALQNDESLLSLLTNGYHPEELSEKEKLKLRLYLTAYLDALILIIHYIGYGYFEKKTEKDLAVVFEYLIKHIFSYPYMVDMWMTNGIYGNGSIRDEYNGELLYVVDSIVLELAINGNN